MKNKHYLKYLKRGLALILTLTLILGLTGCNSSDRNPYGTLDKSATYASSGNLSLTVKELYDELRYNSLDYFNDRIVRAVLDDKIQMLQEEKSSTKATEDKFYYYKLESLVLNDIYEIEVTHTHNDIIYPNHDHEAEIINKIDELKQVDRDKKIATYIDEMFQKGYIITKETIINRDYEALFDIYAVDLAKYYLALEQIEKTIKETNDKATENEDMYFTDEQIVSYFDNNYKDIADVEALIIRFINQDEVNSLMRKFGLKSYKNEWYLIPEPREGDQIDITNQWQKEADYNKYYDDYTINPVSQGDVAVRLRGNDKETILKIMIEMFNYIYPYRGTNGQPPLTYPGYEDIADSTVEKDYLVYYYRIKNIIDTDSRSQNENGYEEVLSAIENSEYLQFTKEKLDKFSSSLTSYMYQTLKTEPEEEGEDFTQYTASARSYGNYYYLMFKIDQKESFDFYTINDDNEKIINDTEEAQALKAKIEEILKYDAITESYVTTKFDERMKKASVKIYDSILELLYMNSTTNKYSKTKGTNNKLLGSVKYNKVTYEITVDEAYAYLENISGPKIAMGILFNKYVKTTPYYDKILSEKMGEYKRSAEAILTNFANNSYSSYGYPSSLGKYNFMKLYFKTTSITKAIKDFLMVEDAKSELLKDLPDKVMNTEDFNLFEKLAEYSAMAYNNFYSLSATHIQVYVDMDEDGEPDKDYFAEASATLRQTTTELLNTFIDFVKNSVDDPATAITNAVAQYNKSSRIAPAYCDSTNPAAVECKWAKYKKEGLFVSTASLGAITNTTTLEEDVQQRILDLYQNTDIIMNAAFTTAYLDQNAFLETEYGFNILLITSGEVSTSAKYEDEDNPGLYNNIPIKMGDKVMYLSAENTADLITVEQVEIYFREYFSAGSVSSLPSAVSTALDTYLKPLITRYSGEAHQMIVRLRILDNIIFNPTEAPNGEGRLLENIEIAKRTIDEYLDTTLSTSNYQNWWTEMFAY